MMCFPVRPTHHRQVSFDCMTFKHSYLGTSSLQYSNSNFKLQKEKYGDHSGVRFVEIFNVFAIRGELSLKRYDLAEITLVRLLLSMASEIGYMSSMINPLCWHHIHHCCLLTEPSHASFI